MKEYRAELLVAIAIITILSGLLLSAVLAAKRKTAITSTTMTNEKMQCPKCKGEMVQGFVPDYFHGVGSFVVAWFAGPPKKSFWSKTKAPRGDGVPMGAFRCQKCGFLEFYSDAKFAAH